MNLLIESINNLISVTYHFKNANCNISSLIMVEINH